MKPNWSKPPGFTPFFPRFKSSPRKKRVARTHVDRCQELENNRRRIEKFNMQSSAYLHKLDMDRCRDKEIRTKNLQNIPIQIRQMARLSPRLLKDNSDHSNKDVVEGFTKETVVLPNILSKQRHQSSSSDNKAVLRRNYCGSEADSTLTDYSCMEYNSESEAWTSDTDNTPRSDLGLYDGADVPYKCRKLWSMKNKRKYYLKKHCQIPTRLESHSSFKTAMALQLDRARCQALDKHIQFVNTSYIAGQHVQRPDGTSECDTFGLSQGDDRSSLASRLELMAITSVQEHNLPETFECAGQESPSVG